MLTFYCNLLDRWLKFLLPVSLYACLPVRYYRKNLNGLDFIFKWKKLLQNRYQPIVKEERDFRKLWKGGKKRGWMIVQYLGQIQLENKNEKTFSLLSYELLFSNCRFFDNLITARKLSHKLFSWVCSTLF